MMFRDGRNARQLQCGSLGWHPERLFFERPSGSFRTSLSDCLFSKAHLPNGTREKLAKVRPIAFPFCL
jgi:hypothetical protein